MTRILEINGLPVIDAKKAIVVRITKNDISKAIPKQPDGCAIVRACIRGLHVLEARVHLSRIYLRTNASNWQRYATPPALRDEIIAFDRGGTFSPCEATLAVVRASARTGKGTQGGPSVPPAQRSGKKRRKHHVVTDVRAGPA